MPLFSAEIALAAGETTAVLENIRRVFSALPRLLEERVQEWEKKAALPHFIRYWWKAMI